MIAYYKPLYISKHRYTLLHEIRKIIYKFNTNCTYNGSFLRTRRWRLSVGCVCAVVAALVEHGAAGADVGAADAGVRGGGGAEDGGVHAARLLAEPPQPLRPARHPRRLHLDIHALHAQGHLQSSYISHLFCKRRGQRSGNTDVQISALPEEHCCCFFVTDKLCWRSI